MRQIRMRPRSRTVEAQPRFRITDHTLEVLKSERVPDDVLDNLASIKNQEFTDEQDFYLTLLAKSGGSLDSQYESLILEYAQLPDEQLPQRTQSDASSYDTRSSSSVYADEDLLKLIGLIHSMTITHLDFDPEYLQRLKQERGREECSRYISQIIVKTIQENPEVKVPLTDEDERNVIKAVINEIIGYGPLEPLLEDRTVSDILVNTYLNVYVERQGRLEQESIRFKDNNHLREIINRIVNDVSRRIDRSTPMVDARLDRPLDNGADVQRVRVNAIVEPLAIEGPILSIRKFPEQHMTLQSLVDNQTLTEDMAELLKGVCRAKLNVLISGGTGSGKTTLLNALSAFIPPRERIITIEDTAELHLLQDHVVRLETRPPDPNIPDTNKGEITQRDLVKNSLRMRPDRIIVGEVRGNEAIDMLQAMNTGHEGSLTTIHANSGRDALTRLEMMVAMASSNTASHFIRQSIGRAFHVIIQMARIGDTRKVVSIQEIMDEMHDDIISLQEIFAFEQQGLEGDKVRGEFHALGVPPDFLSRFEARGVDLPNPRMFNADNIVYI